MVKKVLKNANILLLIFICSSPFTMQLYAMDDRKLIEEAIASARIPEDLNKLIPKQFSSWPLLNLAASNNEYHDLLVKLLQHGADITFTGERGRSALQDASLHKEIKNLTTLIAHVKKEYPNSYKTIINCQNSLKHTALHNAVVRGFFEGVEALLHAQADPNLKNTNGDTALHLAAADDFHLARPRIIKLFYLYGANLMMLNNNGFTPEAEALIIQYSCRNEMLLNSQLLQKLLPCESRIQQIRNLKRESDSYFSLLLGDLIASLQPFIIAQHIIQLEDDEPNEKRLFKREA